MRLTAVTVDILRCWQKEACREAGSTLRQATGRYRPGDSASLPGLFVKARARKEFGARSGAGRARDAEGGGRATTERARRPTQARRMRRDEREENSVREPILDVVSTTLALGMAFKTDAENG